MVCGGRAHARQHMRQHVRRGYRAVHVAGHDPAQRVQRVRCPQACKHLTESSRAAARAQQVAVHPGRPSAPLAHLRSAAGLLAGAPAGASAAGPRTAEGLSRVWAAHPIRLVSAPGRAGARAHAHHAGCQAATAVRMHRAKLPSAPGVAGHAVQVGPDPLAAVNKGDGVLPILRAHPCP